MQALLGFVLLHEIANRCLSDRLNVTNVLRNPDMEYPRSMHGNAIYPRQAVCQVCGESFIQTRKRHVNCSPVCSAKVVETTARQLHAKSGPAYEKWKSSLQAAAERL